MQNNIDWEGIQEEIDNATFEAVDEIGNLAKVKLEEKTPEDTLELLDGWNKLPTSESGTLVTAEVENLVDHGIHVEFGRTTTNKKLNYHKPKGSVFYIGVGARMVTRTYDEDAQELFSILERKISSLGV